MGLESFADLDGIVVRADYHQGLAVGIEFFRGRDVRSKAVLVHTGWDAHWATDAYFESHLFLTGEAAAYLRDAGARLVGIIDQSDLLHAAVDDAARLKKQVREVMTTSLRTVPPSAKVNEVIHLLDDGYTPIVMDGDALVGLVTPIDLVNHIRRQLRS